MMASVEAREIRRHALRLLAKTPDGQENTRVIYQQLLDLAYRLVWNEFDELITYLVRAGCVEQRWLQPEIDRMRVLTITQRGIDIVQGTVQDPGIMPPAGVGG